MKNKNLIIIGFSVLILIFASAGIVGYLESKKGTEKAPSSNYKVTYEYYLDEEKVDEMPKNPEDDVIYAYSRYSCTNRVEGEWVNNEWTFTPNVTANSTCKLYFVSTEFEISFKLENATISGLTADEEGIIVSDKKGASGADFIQEIIPNEGYSYKEASCDTENEISWDKDNNELTIKNVTKDTLCTVNFEVSTYEIKAIVENGNGGSTLTIKHGEDANVTISPSVGYQNPTVSCTNAQTGTWENNKLTVKKVTDNSTCTIKFEIITFDVTMNVTNGSASPNGVQKVDYNGSKTFTITPSEGYTVEGYGFTGCDTATRAVASGKLSVTLNNVLANATCNISFVEIEEETPSDTD